MHDIVMKYEEEDFLMLSGIQHFIFCRRQWALIHIEQLWKENVKTVEGAIFHDRTDDPFFTEKRNDIIISRGMRVFSYTLGVSGICDTVEFHLSEEGILINGRSGKWNVLPVEYKRGRPKEHQADELQLCVQAMCLEEMLVCDIVHGYLFYGETRRREKVVFTEEMRLKVSSTLQEMHKYYKRGYTPKVRRHKSCNACSLVELCVPKLATTESVKDYVKRHVEEDQL